ncbi:MAG: CoA transferase [Armatimonadota bacterium]|nr:CoA transferase [Armatimonadota bacterium]MDR7420975.1 CoA transferase [Armatimonadota bacterium]MDR7455418.1 CoA transferase [Armatimonadota bacterium]MDR7487123.1 CoA transferase [Armatimonadota bacterium]MDR7497414.1 CoA transferase [Armatimonadota bacterium]
MSAPLDGIRVVDLTNVLAGPLCTFQLALMGAEVIKVETPGTGDLARQLGPDPALNRALMGASFLAQNAGKRSVTINLKHPIGRRLFERLIASADVLVENFRPGVMARLGLGYEPLSTINPSLIYCAISGFGQDGPLASNPAYDQIIQGMAGVMDVTGDDGTGPLRVGFPVCDTVGGIAGAFAVASALHQRRQTGRGLFIDVSMLEVTLTAMGWVVSNYLIAGERPTRMGNENVTASPSGTFVTGDGLLNIAANRQEQFESLCRLIARPDLAEDARFVRRDDRLRNRHALKVEIERALAARPAAEWELLLNEAGVPAGRVLSVPEILAHPQVAERGLTQRFEEVPGAGRAVTVAAVGFRFSGMRPRAAGPPPRLGEHTDEVLRGLGFTDAEITGFRGEGAV